MVSYYYFMQARTAEEVESAPIYNVKVGASRRAATAHAAVAARSLVSDDFYYCVRSEESSNFVLRLLQSNPRRQRLEINVSDLAKMLETTANVAYVKNLSEVWRSNQSFLTRSVRGAKFLKL